MIWLTIYSNTAVYGEKWVWYFWSHAYFCFFEALNGAFEVQFFQGFIFTPIKDTDNMSGHVAQIFKSENIVKQCL